MAENSKSHVINRSIWIVIRTLAVILILAFLIYLGALDLAKLRSMVFRWWTALAGICIITSLAMSALRWRILLNAVNIHPSIATVLRLSFIGYAFSTIIPGTVSGDIIKAYYVVKGMASKKFEAAMTILLDRILALFTLLFTGCIAIILLLLFLQSYIHTDDQMILLRPMMSVLLISEILLILGFMLCLSEWIRRSRLSTWLTTRAPWHHIIEKIYSSIYLFRDRKIFLGKAVLLSMISQFPLVLGMFCIAMAADETALPFLYFFFLSPLSTILNTIPLGPGGIGSGEAFVEALFLLFGSNNGAEITAIGHLILILLSLIGFFFYITARGSSIYLKTGTESENIQSNYLDL